MRCGAVDAAAAAVAVTWSRPTGVAGLVRATTEAGQTLCCNPVLPCNAEGRRGEGRCEKKGIFPLAGSAWKERAGMDDVNGVVRRLSRAHLQEIGVSEGAKDHEHDATAVPYGAAREAAAW